MGTLNMKSKVILSPFLIGIIILSSYTATAITDFRGILLKSRVIKFV
jgi:hypothetical protein